MTYTKTVKIKSEISHKIQAVKELKKKYGNIFTWHFDFFTDLEMDDRTRGRYHQLQSGPNYPDFFLAYPIHGKAGLYIEAKREAGDLYLTDGITLKNDHCKAQAAELRKLSALGYKAVFAIGSEGIIKEVENYLAGE